MKRNFTWHIILISSVFYLCFGASLSEAKTKITLASGFSLPTYIEEGKDGGIEWEILIEAFNVKNYEVEIIFLPIAQANAAFRNNEVDGLINTTEGVGPEGFYSDIVIQFLDYAISLKKNQFKISSINDLLDKSVLAYLTAHTSLGEEFGKMAQDNSEYFETHNHYTQVRRLYAERVEIIVLDKHIFNYYLNKANHNQHFEDMFNKGVTFHSLFKNTNAQIVFIDEFLRDDFNYGLKSIKENETYARIWKKYTDIEHKVE